MDSAEENPLPKQSEEGCFTNEKLASISPPLIPMVGKSSEIVVEEPVCSQPHHGHDFILHIPANATAEGYVEDSESVAINMPPSPVPTPKRVNFSPLPSPSSVRLNGSPGPSTKGKSSMKNLLPRLSFKFRNTNSETEKAAMLALGVSPELRGKTSIPRTFSLTKIFIPKMKRTSSLPTSPIFHSNPESAHGGFTSAAADLSKGVCQLPMHRSRSVPVLYKEESIKQMDNLGSAYRVVPTTLSVTEQSAAASVPVGTISGADEKNDYAEDIPLEEAVCRICFVELGEGSDTLKMECSCKGELALAHHECAIKWFSIKGNKTCDICKQEVKNLSVTLLRIQTNQTRGHGPLPPEITQYRVWQDVPVLVIVSMLAYFCFLEQLLVNKMGSSAIAISLPFSCILGLLASMTSTTMVRRRYAWIYATIQFTMVVLFAHIFYSLLHVQAVLSVLLATFVGFGGAMCGTSILIEILKWRRMRSNWSASQQDAAQASESSDAPQNRVDGNGQHS
ncbi:uncharacterized protein LOC125205042 isoform X1 [Salvia hispanica]|uniref:uncharacterized protein LOC125205042 isoform X1 n=2 Tax=Salvia hispanica TaxID=49212 RepID=UPI0020095488|nr:uncharacterized protein LOC125205042 isoform X1 [Salvia hispanica]